MDEAHDRVHVKIGGAVGIAGQKQRLKAIGSCSSPDPVSYTHLAEEVDFALPYMNVALGVISPDSNVITTLDNWNADDQIDVYKRQAACGRPGPADRVCDILAGVRVEIGRAHV